jgi:hypothetical protein
VDGHYTRKYATQVGNWNQFQAKYKMWNTKWRDWIQDAKTKEELDKAITEIWNKLGEASRVFSPLLTQSKIQSMVVPTPYHTKKVNALKRRVKRRKNQALTDLLGALHSPQTHRSQLLQATQKSWRDYCEECSRKTPWKIYKACKTGFAKTQIPSTLTLQDGTATSVMETADALLHEFFPDDLIWEIKVAKIPQGRKRRT